MRVRRPAALVTGASSGIGAALARRLARRGHPVGLLARRRQALEAEREAIEAEGGRAAVACADVRDRAAVHAAAEAVAQALGPVGLLVANAGVACEADPLAPDGEAFVREMEVNVLGAHHAIEAVLPDMVARGDGHVVGISSLAARRAVPGAAGYAASKVALTRMLESYAPHWRQAGVVVTIVHPGFVRTAMTADRGFAMPFLLGLDEAADRIDRAIARRRRRCDFPWPARLLVALSRLVPTDWMLRFAPGADRSEGEEAGS